MSSWMVMQATPPWCWVKFTKASWTHSIIKWTEIHMLVRDYVGPTKGVRAASVKTHVEVNQEVWPNVHSAAWWWWVPRCAGTDGTLKGRTWGGTGQAGATWLVETDEVWVLETAVASSSPNGFFPQHTVVIIQFLNWGPQTKGLLESLVTG